MKPVVVNAFPPGTGFIVWYHAESDCIGINSEAKYNDQMRMETNEIYNTASLREAIHYAEIVARQRRDVTFDARPYEKYL
jgi:hypothetical protein